MAVSIIPKIARWAKKGGKVKRGSTSRHDNSHSKPRTDAAILAENARALGWLNGQRLAKRTR